MCADGIITDLDQCKRILKENNTQISNVKLYFNTHLIGYELMEKLIWLFQGIYQEIYIYDKLRGHVEVDFDFQKVDFDYIMKDSSLQFNVCSAKQRMDKKILKRNLCALQTRILKDFNNITIRNFYEDKDIDGCVNYIRIHTKFFHNKRTFENIMSSIMKYVDGGLLNLFSESNKPSFRVKTKSNLKYHQMQMKCEKKFTTGYFGINLENNNEFKIGNIMSPFKLLECTSLRKQIVSFVSEKSNKSNHFYLLHSDTNNIDNLIEHNNYILSKLLQSNLPGEPIIWHMIFIYILATDKKFENLKDILFNEIKFLGNEFEYYICFSPNLQPAFKEKINICFWYIANVCHKAFPNTQQNVLRSANFISGAILKFYKDVYNKNYEYPITMAIVENVPQYFHDGAK